MSCWKVSIEDADSTGCVSRLRSSSRWRERATRRPASASREDAHRASLRRSPGRLSRAGLRRTAAAARARARRGRSRDRKSTRLNSSHLVISYAVFCLKKKNETLNPYFCACFSPHFDSDRVLPSTIAAATERIGSRRFVKRDTFVSLHLAASASPVLTR